MRSLMNGLPLQALAVLLIICSANGAPYSKYGRTCKDIGCLPREVCVMAYESCSFNQQENVSCGRYPTCKKNQDGQATQQNAGASYNPSNAAPDNVRPQSPEPIPPRDYGRDRDPVNPNNVFGYPTNNNMYHQVPPHQIPLDYPRLPDNRQAFPASPNGGSYPYPYHPQLTPPPNVFGPFRKSDFVTTTKSPGLLDQFLYNKSPRNASPINSASLNLTLLSLLFLLIYRIRSDLA